MVLFTSFIFSYCLSDSIQVKAVTKCRPCLYSIQGCTWLYKIGTGKSHPQVKTDKHLSELDERMRFSRMVRSSDI
jgi:hypothetical protein